MNRLLMLGLALALLGGCARQAVARVQHAHGHEFHCDRRYVRAERVAGPRWVSRGCGFEAQWTCVEGTCELEDSRAHGMGGP